MVRELGLEVITGSALLGSNRALVCGWKAATSQVDGDGGVVTAWREAGGWVVVSMI